MTELAVQSRVATPATIGQATAVEQARAEAEVKAAVVVAQQCPRNVPAARAQMIESCEQIELANRAFFRYSRAGSQITGPTIHLARELARCWGNVQYGIAELRRDDTAGESEMMAFAWDVQTNTRSSSTFIVPHIRERGGSGHKLTDTRDIYENNANMGARRVREAIFAILPPWFTEQAKTVCNATIEKGDGTPLPDRIAGYVTAYEKAGISKRQLEDKVGVRVENWTARDVAALAVVWRSLVARESTREEEFPTADAPAVDPSAPAADRMRGALGTPTEPASNPAGTTVSGAEDAPDAPSPASGERPETSASESSSGVTKAQLTKIGALCTELEMARAEALGYVASVIGREVGSRKDLTKDEASQVIESLAADADKAARP